MNTFLYGTPPIYSVFEYFEKLSCVSILGHYIKLNLYQEKYIFDQEPQKIANIVHKTQSNEKKTKGERASWGT